MAAEVSHVEMSPLNAEVEVAANVCLNVSTLDVSHLYQGPRWAGETGSSAGEGLRRVR